MTPIRFLEARMVWSAHVVFFDDHASDFLIVYITAIAQKKIMGRKR